MESMGDQHRRGHDGGWRRTAVGGVGLAAALVEYGAVDGREWSRRWTGGPHSCALGPNTALKFSTKASFVLILNKKLLECLWVKKLSVGQGARSKLCA